MVIGGGIGILAGYFGGGTDSVLMRITDYFLVIPDLPLMIIVAAVWGPSLSHLIIVIGAAAVDHHRADHPRPGEERPRARLRQARAVARRRATAGSSSRHVCRRSAPLLIANTVLTIAVRDLRRDGAGVPRPGRPDRDHLGDDDRARVPAHRDLLRRLVGDRPAGPVRRARDHGLLPGSARRSRTRSTRGCGSPTCRPRALPPPAAAGRARPDAGEPARGARPARLVRPARRREAARGAGRVASTLDAGERLGPRRRVRLRQDHDDPRAAWGCCRRRRPSPGRSCSTATNILAGGEDAMRPHRWTDIAMVFQGAMNALNPVQDGRVADRRADGAARHRVGRRGEGRGRASCSRWSASRPRRGDALPARVLRRHAAARRDRDGARLRAEGAAGRRADDRARRDGAGADPGAARCGSRDELGLALVLVTHDLPVVAQVCERAAVMYAGEIAEARPVDELFHDPRHPYTRLLFAATPDLYGEDAVRLDPRRAAAAGPRVVGLPVPPALRPRVRSLRGRAPAAACRSATAASRRAT